MKAPSVEQGNIAWSLVLLSKLMLNPSASGPALEHARNLIAAAIDLLQADLSRNKRRRKA